MLETLARMAQSTLTDKPSKTVCTGGREVSQVKIGTSKGREFCCDQTAEARSFHVGRRWGRERVLRGDIVPDS